MVIVIVFWLHREPTEGAGGLARSAAWSTPGEPPRTASTPHLCRRADQFLLYFMTFVQKEHSTTICQYLLFLCHGHTVTDFQTRPREKRDRGRGARGPDSGPAEGPGRLGDGTLPGSVRRTRGGEFAQHVAYAMFYVGEKEIEMSSLGI